MSNENRFKDSLNLPKTDFPIVYNKARDLELIAFWDKKQIFDNNFSNKLSVHGPAKSFVLPWGPPYANGPLHMGHALNGILKDFVCKIMQKQGFAVHFKFGSDCHGMPIEIKVAEELNYTKENIETDPVAFKKKCREYANKWIEIQKKGFANLGIFANYKNGYKTLDTSYEAAILRSFGSLVEKGFISRRNKSVPWCMHCETVLASAEIEYKDRKDPSVFVKFKLTSESFTLLEQKINKKLDKNAYFFIWTTTPWTLPLNKAIAYHPDANYAVVDTGEEYLIIGENAVSRLTQKFKKDLTIVGLIHSKDLHSFKAEHILQENEVVPLIYDAQTSLEDGTAFVHIAPGCGPEDYLLGIKFGLEIFSPVNAKGEYTSLVKIQELIGQSVGNVLGKILLMLTQRNSLFFKESINHSYPHCWRCRNGLIFRATKQWFCDLSKNDLQQRTLSAINQVKFIPDWGRARFESFIKSRTEWCISRQRVWGVPIVALKCTHCEDAFVDTHLISIVAQEFEKYGIEFWDDVTLKELEKIGAIKENLTCKSCGHSRWDKELDTLDVWFDSGVQHTAVLFNENPNYYPSSMLLEGSDQHRGWFQSSMLTALAMHDKPCSQAILTHGFVVDEQREKMSKSKGNVINPEEVVKKYCVDVLRLWVASSDYEKDISVSWDKIASVAESFRKIRNTCRFMLSNLYDVDTAALFEKNYLKNFNWQQLSCLDRIFLGRFRELIKRVDQFSKDFKFAQVIHDINSFCTVELSAEYFDMVKTRLYAEAPNSALRHNTQIIFVLILDYLTHRMSPYLSFLAEDVYQSLRKGYQSIFEESSPSLENLDQIISHWDVINHFDKISLVDDLLSNLRKASLKEIEILREQQIVKQAIETAVNINLDLKVEQATLLSTFFKIADSHEGSTLFLANWIGTSQATITFSKQQEATSVLPWLSFNVQKALGNRCERCWIWFIEEVDNRLCLRCNELINPKI